MEGSKKLITFSHNILYFLFSVSKLLANFGSNLDPWKGDINSGRDWVPGVGETAILIIFWRFVRNGKNFWGPRRWMDAWVTIKYFSQSLESLMTRCCLNNLFLSSNETPPALPRLSAKNFKDLRSWRSWESMLAALPWENSSPPAPLDSLATNFYIWTLCLEIKWAIIKILPDLLGLTIDTMEKFRILS